MNKSRPMVSRQARLLAGHGNVVVVPDLFGTGDSSGDFGEANWQRWSDNMTAVLDWATARGARRVCLWGLRLGCLLALETARERPEQVNRLMLWQPVSSGKQHITQFLRLRMAAGLQGGSGDSTAELRQRLFEGEFVEVAGYDIAPDLVSQLDDVTAMSLAPPPGTEVFWLELVSREGKPMSPASRNLVEAWERAGCRIESRLVHGEAFWTAQEVTLAPHLLALTGQLLEDRNRDEVADSVLELGEPEEYEGNDVAPVVFGCQGDELVGILNPGADSASVAVLVIVGGPQYRVGSHRQFVHLARALSQAGIPVLRFDYRGMGDSSGEYVGFENSGPDIACAIDALQRSLPQVHSVILWGLCDAASAATFYAPVDNRVAGMVLVNPWVHSDRGRARTYLKHYYIQRLVSGEFWKKFIRGGVDLPGSTRSAAENVWKAIFRREDKLRASCEENPEVPSQVTAAPGGSDLVNRVYQGLADSRCPVLFIFSGRDLTAAEFLDAVAGHRKFSKLLRSRRCERRDIVEADHTFSTRVWRDQVANWTVSWIRSLH